MTNTEQGSGAAPENKDRPFTDDDYSDTADSAQNSADVAREGALGAETNSDLELLTKQLAEQKAKADENWGALLRAKAEMENLRKRHVRELEHAHKFAIEKFVLDVIPVKDSLELGLQAAAAEGADIDSIVEGVELTHKMLAQAFERFKIESVDPQGEKFDPEKHEAMSMIPSPDYPTGTVITVVQNGYLLNGRSIRPAMVVVSKGPGPDGEVPKVDTTA